MTHAPEENELLNPPRLPLPLKPPPGKREKQSLSVTTMAEIITA